MLPKMLTEILCSVRGEEESLCFSVVWEMTKEAEVVNTRYAKTVVHSKGALSYEVAWKRICDKSLNDPVTKGLRWLQKLSEILKQKRIDAGARPPYHGRCWAAERGLVLVCWPVLRGRLRQVSGAVAKAISRLQNGCRALGTNGSGRGMNGPCVLKGGGHMQRWSCGSGRAMPIIFRCISGSARPVTPATSSRTQPGSPGTQPAAPKKGLRARA